MVHGGLTRRNERRPAPSFETYIACAVSIAFCGVTCLRESNDPGEIWRSAVGGAVNTTITDTSFIDASFGSDYLAGFSTPFTVVMLLSHWLLRRRRRLYGWFTPGIDEILHLIRSGSHSRLGMQQFGIPLDGSRYGCPGRCPILSPRMMRKRDRLIVDSLRSGGW